MQFWNIVRDFELWISISTTHRSSHLDRRPMHIGRALHLCLAYLIRTRALAKVGAGVSDDDSGRSPRRYCARLRRFPSKCRRMRLVYPGVRRRHCRNYPLRPPGPSERCLASAPYLEPARLSSRPRWALSLTRSPCPFPRLPTSSRYLRRTSRSYPRFPRSPSRGPLKPNQPTSPTNHPPTHFA